MSRRSALVVGVVVVVVTAGFIVPAISATVLASHTGPIPADQTFNAADGVDVWERSVFTLRSEETDDANVEVPNAALTLVDHNQNANLLEKDPLLVYDVPDGEIELTFDQQRGGSAVFPSGDVNAELIRAHLDSDANMTARSFSGALDLLTAENANDNATFEEVEEPATISGGTATFDDTVAEPGQYVYFLALNESGKDGFEVDGNGDLSVDGEVTVIGVDTVVVRTADPHIAPPTRTIVSGRTANFTVAQDGFPGTPPSTVTHVFALYHEGTYVNSMNTLNATEEIDSDFDFETDATFDSSIGSVNGVADIEDGATVRGVDINDGELSGTFTVIGIVDFLAEKADADAPPVTTGTETLDGSVHSFEGHPNTTKKLSVRTFDNWTATSPGADRNYRWIYLAVTEDTQVFSIETGEVRVLAAPPTPPSPPPGGGGGGGGGGGFGGGPPIAPPGPQTQVTTPASNQATATAQGVLANTPFSIDLPPLAEADDPDPEAVVLEQLTLSSGVDGDFNFQVTKTRGPPSTAPGLEGSGSRTPLRYFDITHDLPDDDIEEATFRFRVRKGLLDDLDRGPGNVALFRFNGGQWGPVSAGLVDETPTHYVFTASPPGLSAFAVGVGEPAFAVRSATLAPASIEPGGQTRVTASVENTGEGPGEFTAELTVDGSVLDAFEVTIPAGETREVAFDVGFQQAGTYAVGVSGTSAGELSVAGPVTDEPEGPTGPPEQQVPGPEGPAGPGDDGPPGVEFGSTQLALIALIAAMVVVIAVLAYVRRRQL